MTILNRNNDGWIARLKGKFSAKDMNKNNTNQNNDNNNNSGAIPITLAAIALCVIPMLFIAVTEANMAVASSPALDASQNAVGARQGNSGIATTTIDTITQEPRYPSVVMRIMEEAEEQQQEEEVEEEEEEQEEQPEPEPTLTPAQRQALYEQEQPIQTVQTVPFTQQPRIQYMQGQALTGYGLGGSSSGSIVPVQDVQEEPQDVTNEVAQVPIEEDTAATANTATEATTPPQTGLETVPQDGVTTATPEAGITTTPVEPTTTPTDQVTTAEITNPATANSRTSLPASTQLQEYVEFKDTLIQSGYNFNDNSVIYTESSGDGRRIMIVTGTEGNTDQPPSMILEEIAAGYGFQMLAYTYSSQGELITIFLEAF